MIYILSFVLLFILVFVYRSFKTIIAPPVLVSFGMFLASVIASIYYEEWEMYKLTFETFLIIGGGTTFFSFCCVLLNNRFTSKIKICPIVLHCSFFDCKRMIPFYVFVNAITLFSSYAKYSYLKSFFGSYSLLELIAARHMDGHGESDALIVMPVIPRMAASFSQVVCFVSVWCLALMLYSKEKNRYLLLLICIHVTLVTFDMMLSGSKGSMITMPISFLTIMTFFHYSKIGKFYIKKSFFVLIFLFLMCSATLFKGLSIIVGRDVEDRDAIELLAGYSGAEIKNLDIYLHNHPDGQLSKDFGANTFYAWYKEIGIKTNRGVSDEYHEINGFLLGNVSTMFYPYHVDFGIGGVFVMMILISIVSMYAYLKSLKRISNPLNLNVYILLYSSIFSLSLFMAFFSSKITENVFRPGFLRMILYTVFIVWFFKKILFKKQIR